MSLDRARAMVAWLEGLARTRDDLTRLHVYADAKSVVEQHDGPEGRPEDGHRWTFSVSCRPSSCVVGQPLEDSDEPMGEPATVTVRAWDLPAACRKASLLPLVAWFPNDEEASRG